LNRLKIKVPPEGKSHMGKRVNVSSYIAQYPLLWTARSALYTLLPWQTCSFKLIWEIFNHAAINARCLLVQISTTLYSQEFIDTAVKTLAQSLTSQCKTRTRVLLVENPKLSTQESLRSNIWVCVTIYLSIKSRIQGGLDELSLSLSYLQVGPMRHWLWSEEPCIEDVILRSLYIVRINYAS